MSYDTDLSTCVPFTLNNYFIRQLFKFKITVQNMIHASVQLYQITIHASFTFFNCISNRIFNRLSIIDNIVRFLL